jgi:2-pyrone-4,6-dicarboxylate lactonase
MAEPVLTYMRNPSKPHLRLPAGACNTHCHIFGPQNAFPFASGLKVTPADAPKETLFALHDMLGIDYCVIVQSTTHGFDNTAVSDALIAKAGTYCAVALLPTDVSDPQLRRLDAQGFRGVRFHYMKHLAKGAPIEEVLAFAKRLADIGWHLQIHCESALINELAPALKRSPVPVVIDHMGRVDASRGLDQPDFRHLLALMEDPKLYVKVSGCDRITRQGPPYADAVPFARKLVAEFGDRTFWGTDWPHPNHAGPIPDDGVLVDLIAEIAPLPAQRRALLVDNPQRFYRFAKPFSSAADKVS